VWNTEATSSTETLVNTSNVFQYMKSERQYVNLHHEHLKSQYKCHLKVNVRVREEVTEI